MLLKETFWVEDYKPFKDASLACFAGSLFMSPFIEYMKQDGELVHAFLYFVSGFMLFLTSYLPHSLPSPWGRQGFLTQ